MNYCPDTIAAISTPSGMGAIAVIRVSGNDAIEIVNDFILSRNLIKIKSRYPFTGKFSYENQILDEVLCTIFRQPNSYTGENLVEISCHGNPYLTQRILEALLTRCRLADPGEFTQRAFLNNKMDLTQAEAVGDLLQAKTKYAHIAAIDQLEGRLFTRIKLFLDELTSLRAMVELEIDFIEQDLDELDSSKLKKKMETMLIGLKKLLASGNEGMILRDGLKVSLAGAPNVGKSSIFNAFLQTERAIVTPQPGTTRDYLEEAVALQGYLIRLYDTAGLRDSSESAEKIGIERSYDIIKKSHKTLYIVDENENLIELEKIKQLIEPENIILVLNKSDLFSEDELKSYRKKGYIPCSTLSAAGLDQLKQALLQDIIISEADLHAGILVNVRQIAAVKKAVSALNTALQSLEEELGYEFIAFDLKEASTSLEEIIGKITDDDILNHIFEHFCIGK
jgi:tRNA modification GTPase